MFVKKLFEGLCQSFRTAIGNEGFFGGPAWWADLRPMHGKLWALYAATGKWQFVAVDTLAGAAAWKLVNGKRQSAEERAVCEVAPHEC